MYIYTIVATHSDTPGAVPVIGVGSTFARAETMLNDRLARKGEWIYLHLPEADASVIRSTPQGNIRFAMEHFNVERL